MQLFDLKGQDILISTPTQQRAWDFVRHAAGEVENIHTTMRLLSVGEHFFPVSINHGERQAKNSYVVSPVNTYGEYGEFELNQLKFGRFFRFLPRGVGALLQIAQCDQILYVNNWLLSTNLYPLNWQGEELPELIEYLVALFPHHVIGFRTLNESCNATLIAQLKKCGFLNVPCRQIYGLEGQKGRHSPWLKKRNNQKDRKLLSSMPYQLITGEEFTKEDFQQLATLYQQLNCQKYCSLNPQVNAKWLFAGQRDGWLELRALQDEARRIVGGVGWFSDEVTLTLPILGYDLQEPQEAGLYRLLMQLTIQEAVRRQCFLHLSSGAASFKRLRGGVAEIESSFVYIRHLPKKRQFIWRALSQILHSVGVPLVRRWQL